MKVSFPGIGGSLGECVVCGECFASEILLGQTIPTIGIDGFGDVSLPLHKKCLETLEGLRGQGWESLPAGPLRREHEEAFAELTASTDSQVTSTGVRSE